MMDRSDEQLISDYLDGDCRAFDRLVGRYLRPLYRFASQLVGPAEAEDVVQDAFVKAWKKLDRFDPSLGFRPWIYRIAKNTAFDRLKKKRPLPFSAFDDDGGGNSLAGSLADDKIDLPAMFDADITAEKLAAAVDRLPPSQKTVVDLRYREEMSFEEIAAVLEEPAATVRSRHRRALLRLRQTKNTRGGPADAAGDAGATGRP